MKTPKHALEAVADAAAALNYAVMLHGAHSSRIGALEEEVERLSRAVARVQMLITVDPDATVETPVPQHFAPQDDLDRAMTLELLQTIAAMPSAPVSVALRVRRFHDGSREDTLRALLEGMVLTAVPAGHRYEIDVNRIASEIGQNVL